MPSRPIRDEVRLAGIRSILARRRPARRPGPRLSGRLASRARPDPLECGPRLLDRRRRARNARALSESLAATARRGPRAGCVPVPALGGGLDACARALGCRRERAALVGPGAPGDPQAPLLLRVSVSYPSPCGPPFFSQP